MVKIFVGNIADGVTDDELKELFLEHGKVTECDVLGSYGFVHMDSDGDAENAISKLDKHQLKGQAINVEKSSGGKSRGGGGGGYNRGSGGGRGGGGFRGGFRGPPMGGGGYGGMRGGGGDSQLSKSARRQGCTKLHVAGFPDGCHSGELRRMFERYGFVAECDIVEDKKIAFVHIEDAAADAAINGLNNYNFKGMSLKVQMSKNQRREPGNNMPPRGYGGGGGGMGMGGMGRGPGMGGGMRNNRMQNMPSNDYGANDYGNGAGGFGYNDGPMGGSNGDGYGADPALAALPPPAKDRMELLDLLDRRRRLEALDPYERRLIASDPFNLPPPTPEYLRLLRERALVKSRLPMPPNASKVEPALPTAGTTTTSNSLTRAIIARRVAQAQASSTANTYTANTDPSGFGANTGSLGMGNMGSYGNDPITGYGHTADNNLAGYGDLGAAYRGY